MGVIILGTFALNVEGIGGSIFLMISHGLVSGALFMLVGMLYDRRHTKMISEFGGLASVMPKFAVIFALMLMASVGLPLTIGFVGEFLSLLGFFKVSPIIASLAGLTIILGAVYMLVMYKSIFFGKLDNKKNEKLIDINKNEVLALVPLCILVVLLGIFPKIILTPVNTSVNELVNIMEIKAVKQSSKDTLRIINVIGGK